MSLKPLVSVSIVTFQHERFLAQAIESVLAQRTTFPIEIVVGVDGGGDDRTADIARAYAQQYPDRVVAICHSTRGRGVPGRVNNMSNLRACRGKYIATLDGDDLFADPDKLQRQVDALEADPTLSLCFHDAEVFWDDGSRPAESFYEKRSVFVRDRFAEADFGLLDLARWGHSYIPSSAVMVRADCLRPLPEWFDRILAADYAIQLLACAEGGARYLPFTGSRYRQHRSSVTHTDWQDLPNLRRKAAELDIYAQHFGLPAQIFDFGRAWTAYSIAESCTGLGDYHAAKAALRTSLRSNTFVFTKRTKDVLKRRTISLAKRAASYVRPDPETSPIAKSSSVASAGLLADVRSFGLALNTIGEAAGRKFFSKAGLRT